MIEVGESYSRKEISQHLGGNPFSGLPDKDGRVLYACLHLKNNNWPDRVILAGLGKRRARRGQLLAQQGGSIPVFLFIGDGKWRCEGYFAVADSTDDPVRIAAVSNGREDVSRALFMVESPR